jgi:hypothetical protein
VLEQFFLLNSFGEDLDVLWLFRTVAGKASAVIDTTVALASYLSLA